MDSPTETFRNLTNHTAEQIITTLANSNPYTPTRTRVRIRQLLAGYAAALETLFDADNPLEHVDTLPIRLDPPEKPRPIGA